MKVTKRGVGAALLTLLAAAVCVRLGIWQLHRLAERRASNAVLVHATALPPLALRDDLSAVFRSPEEFVDRRARVTGTFLPGRDLVLRGRALQGEPGVNLVGALQVAGSDTVVLVDRGWVGANDAASVDPAAYPAPGTLTVS
ncbi:MAG TPA: SURF1 family protein, partial [Longimicrobiaceae bacterium]|nr:SURF1 family protein [Longimicrobiaceae bacterium]